MRADPVYFSVIKNDDLIRIHDGCYSLRNDNFCDILPRRQCLADLFLRCRVDRTCRIIEDQDFCLSDQRTRDAETLLLASGEVACALLEHGAEAVRHAVQKFIRTRRAACFPDLLIGCIRIAPFQVFTHGSGEQHVFLQNDIDCIAESGKIVRAHILSADADGAPAGVIQTRNELHQRRFRRTCSSEDSYRLTGFDLQRNIGECVLFCFFFVFKRYVVKLHAALCHFCYTIFRRGEHNFLIEHLDNPVCARHGTGQEQEDVCNHHHRVHDLHNVA